MNDLPPHSKKPATSSTSDAVFVLGGARSGKSAYAQCEVEFAAAASGREPVYIATAQAWDDEMRARIANHIVARKGRWRTVEAPYELVAALDAEVGPSRIVLVDCLTLWLTNIMLRGDDVEAASVALADGVAARNGGLVLVSNEVGQGIVPDNALARRFRDAQGRLNQVIATACDQVVLVAAGLPLVMKPALVPRLRL